MFGPSVANRLLTRLAGNKPAGNAPLPQLTNRKRQVLDLVAAD